MKRKREDIENEEGKLDVVEIQQDKNELEYIQKSSEELLGKIDKMIMDKKKDEEEDDDVYLSDDFVYDGSDEDEEIKELKEIIKERKRTDLFPKLGEFEDGDSDEDESNINTIGNVPMWWYEEYDHLGYDREGKKIIKKEKGDELDNLVNQKEDPNFLRKIYDEYNETEHELSNEDLQNIINIQKGMFPSGYDPYRKTYFTHENDPRFPIKNDLGSKRSNLLIDLDEQRKIRKIKNRILYKNHIPMYRKEYVVKEKFFHVWDENGNVIGGQGKHPGHLLPPKERLPKNKDSFHPPLEYIEDEEERNDIKQIYKIPQNDEFINERLKRCMELYLCPREIIKTYPKQKPEDLFPKNLPHPKDLRPYPEIQSVVYEGHSDMVKTISCDPTGQWLISGDEYGSVRLWEVDTGRCMRVWNFASSIEWLEWNPNPEINLFACACENIVYLISPPGISTKRVNENTKNLFPDTEYLPEKEKFELSDEDLTDDEEEEEEEEEEEGKEDDDYVKKVKRRNKKGKKRLVLEWNFNKKEGRERIERLNGILAKLIHIRDVNQVSWHYKGDYFCSLSKPFIFIHQLSTRKSQKPFVKKDRKKGGKYTKIFFHTSKPLFFVCTRRKIKIYDLQKQKLKRILSKQRCKYISDVDIHPNGNNLIIGGYDKRLEWFEFDVSSKPTKSMKFHRETVRSVKFHKKYPLFASCSDDANIHIFHQTVYDDDLVKDPLIVPLKLLKAHKKVKFLGVLNIEFHPFQPWLFSAGADKTIRLFTC